MTTAYHYPNELQLINLSTSCFAQRSRVGHLFDDEPQAFCKRMLTAMHEYSGVGLAAPQVGVSKQIFVGDHAGLLGEGPSQGTGVD